MALYIIIFAMLDAYAMGRMGGCSFASNVKYVCVPFASMRTYQVLDDEDITEFSENTYICAFISHLINIIRRRKYLTNNDIKEPGTNERTEWYRSA